MAEPQVVEVVTRLGDTIVDVTHVDGLRHDLGWAPIHVDGFVATIAGTAHAVDATPLHRRFGRADITFTRVARPARSVPYPFTADRRAVGYLAASLAAHLFLWGYASDHAPPAHEARVQLDEVRAIPIHRTRMPATGHALELGLEEDTPDRATPGRGTSMALDEGILGEHTSRTKRGHILIARRDEPATLSHAAALEEARHAGVLGATAIGAGIASLTGGASVSSGFDELDVRGPRYGGDGEAAGSFGFSRSCDGGACLGGGGEGWGTIGSQRYGTFSNGNSDGNGWGGGRPGAGTLERRRESVVPMIRMCGGGGGATGCVRVVGDLDKAIVRRYIRRHLAKLQYCYEKELLATPGLAGTVETELTILPSGTVQDATASGVSEAVSSCVAGVLGAIEFPRTDGTTLVHYPFELRAPY